MQVNYDKLWKLMIDKKINKTVKMETLVRICKVFDCKLDDIVDMK